jgi:tripartite-type tricarboxylate transporter receptor subunit TctC
MNNEMERVGMARLVSLMTRLAGALAGLALAGFSPGSAAADDVAAFYSGQTMKMIIGYPPGGSNDIYARIVAQYIGKYIPGAPHVIASNMPGAGSLTAANHIFNVAPRDGTILGAVSQGIPLQAKLGQANVKYEPGKFYWVGRMASSSNVTMVWNTSKIMRFEDTRRSEVTLGATGTGSTVALYPSVMNEILKTKFKLIMGYKGSAEAMLAMERGEVEGHSTTWEAVKAIHPDWVRDGRVRLLVQHGLNRNGEMPEVPTSVELTTNPEDRAVMRVIMGAAEVGKAYFTTPAVPIERVAALRRAFDQMIKDPMFVEAVEKVRGEVGAMRGEDLQDLIGELDTLPPALLDRVKSIYVE